MALDTLDPLKPVGSDDPNQIDEFIRETRQAIIDSFEVEHNLAGTHQDDFLKTIMIQADAVDKNKINDDIANVLKGIERNASTKQLQMLIDTTVFEFDGITGELKIKAGADLARPATIG